MKDFPFTIDEKELPEWYHMAKEFFQEINCYSSSMYEDMSGHAILNQIRYAAERDYYRSLEVSILDKLAEQRLTPRPPDAGESAASQTLSPQSGESTPEVDPAATQRR